MDSGRGLGRVQRLPVLRWPCRAEPLAVIAAASAAVVADAPMWSQVADVLPAPTDAADALADLFDLPVFPTTAAPDATAEPSEEPTPSAVIVLLPDAPQTFVECEAITVDGVDVAWWVGPPRDRGAAPTPYAATTAGLARALAQASGAWHARSAVELLLADPTRAGEFTAEDAWDRAGANDAHTSGPGAGRRVLSV